MSGLQRKCQVPKSLQSLPLTYGPLGFQQSLHEIETRLSPQGFLLQSSCKNTMERRTNQTLKASLVFMLTSQSGPSSSDPCTPFIYSSRRPFPTFPDGFVNLPVTVTVKSGNSVTVSQKSFPKGNLRSPFPL